MCCRSVYVQREQWAASGECEFYFRYFFLVFVVPLTVRSRRHVWLWNTSGSLAESDWEWEGDKRNANSASHCVKWCIRMQIWICTRINHIVWGVHLCYAMHKHDHLANSVLYFCDGGNCVRSSQVQWHSICEQRINVPHNYMLCWNLVQLAPNERIGASGVRFRAIFNSDSMHAASKWVSNHRFDTIGSYHGSRCRWLKSNCDDDKRMFRLLNAIENFKCCGCEWSRCNQSENQSKAMRK